MHEFMMLHPVCFTVLVLGFVLGFVAFVRSL
jgi:hypothetical protein